MPSEAPVGRKVLPVRWELSLTKPLLGLAVGGALGLLDGLSGFLEPSLAPMMGSIITFSLLKGLISGVIIGYFSKRVHSMPLGILAGVLIASVFSMLLILKAGMALFWDIVLPGMLLGVIVGFATQRFGRPPAVSSARHTVSVSPGQLQK
jgi:hypothetical protein